MACGRCARRRAADQGKNSSGGLNARWMAMWPVRSLVHLVVWLCLITALIGDDSSIRLRNIALEGAGKDWTGGNRHDFAGGLRDLCRRIPTSWDQTSAGCNPVSESFRQSVP